MHNLDKQKTAQIRQTLAASGGHSARQKILTTKIQIFIGLALLTFSSCSDSPTSTVDETKNQKQNPDQTTCVKIIGGQFKIDTGLILINKNLPALYADLNKTNIADKKTVSDIPNFIRAFLDSISDDKDFSIANPNENWQSGCTNIRIVDEKGKVLSKQLATKQLVYFGLGDNIALLSYYVGGIAKSQQIAIIKFEGGKIIDFWFKNNIPFVTTKNDLIETIKILSKQNGIV